MTKSRKVFLAALVILLIAQFFDYGTDSMWSSIFNWGTRERRNVLQSFPINGWVRNAWFDAAIPILLYLFYKAERKTFIYIIGLCCIIILGWGEDFGGTVGFISILVAAYGVYLKVKQPN